MTEQGDDKTKLTGDAQLSKSQPEVRIQLATSLEWAFPLTVLNISDLNTQYWANRTQNYKTFYTFLKNYTL